MKSVQVAAFLFVVIISAGMPSCKKQVVSVPADNNNNPGSSIPHSGWVHANWQNNQFNISVLELTNDLLVNGKVLVYGEGGFENSQYPVLLPGYLDANRVSINESVGNLQLEITGTGAVSNSLYFSYILIPPIILAQSMPLDYSNYFAVCEYYHIDQ